MTSGKPAIRQMNTQALISHNSRLRRLIEINRIKGKTGTLNQNLELTLWIRGMIERFVFRDRFWIILGRLDEQNNVHVDIDLLPYGAYERGVSRVHAQFQLIPGNRLYIMDMASANGTYVAGQRLEAFKPCLLRNGDHLVLGSLPIQVLFG